MILGFLLLILNLAHADAPIHWNHLTEVSDRHEFYENNETIIKPKDSWQTLFSVVYSNIDLKRLKDCVYYRVPGVEPGILKIKTISSLDSCDKHILEASDKVWTEIRSLQFLTSSEKLTLDMTFPKYKNEKWSINIQHKFEKPEPKMQMSSTELKSGKLIFLAPKNDLVTAPAVEKLSANSLCHNVNEDCEELSSSVCSQCDEGWYEVQNGCRIAPKYCGRDQCGEKDKPACRRGFKWQRKDEEKFDCRMDSSFAYCSKGLTVACQGALAYCR